MLSSAEGGGNGIFDKPVERGAVEEGRGGDVDSATPSERLLRRHAAVHMTMFHYKAHTLMDNCNILKRCVEICGYMHLDYVTLKK